MSEQPPLPGFELRPSLDFLFFGLLPTAREASAIVQLRRQLCDACGLERRRLIGPERLHVSLHGIGEYDGLPRSVVRKAEEAGARAVMRSFEIRFDRAMSFACNRDRRAFVLCAVREPVLLAFHRTLGSAMKWAGLRRVKSGFTPHLTLLYVNRIIAERPIGPISMTAQSLVLVHSLRGRSKYHHLASWPLQGASQFENVGQGVPL
jgi:2'-5' RNA ligase